MSKKNVCVDVDGVIAHYDGWKGHDHIGDPIEGAREFLLELSKEYYVIIFTTRCCPVINEIPDDYYPELSVSDRAYSWRINLVNKVKEYFDKNDLYYDHIWSDNGKPKACAYIDDRAVECLPQVILRDSKLWYDRAVARVWELAND